MAGQSQTGDKPWLDGEAFEMMPGSGKPRTHGETADDIALDLGKGTHATGKDSLHQQDVEALARWDRQREDLARLQAEERSRDLASPGAASDRADPHAPRVRTGRRSHQQVAEDAAVII